MDATEGAREGGGGRGRGDALLKVPSLIFLVLLRRKRTGDGRARTRARTGSLLAHARGGLSLHFRSLSSQTHSQHRRLPGRRDGSRARRDSLNLHNASLVIVSFGRQCSVPSLPCFFTRDFPHCQRNRNWCQIFLDRSSKYTLMKLITL